MASCWWWCPCNTRRRRAVKLEQLETQWKEKCQREQAEAMTLLLSLLCECVVWLAADGDTVIQSDDAFDELTRQSMQGGSLKDCFAGSNGELDNFKEALQNAAAGPVCSSAVMRGSTAVHVNVYVVDLRGRGPLRNASKGPADAKYASPCFLVGIRRESPTGNVGPVGSGPRGTPSSLPRAVSDGDWIVEPGCLQASLPPPSGDGVCVVDLQYRVKELERRLRLATKQRDQLLQELREAVPGKQISWEEMYCDSLADRHPALHPASRQCSKGSKGSYQDFVKEQIELGAQSKRGGASQHQLSVLEPNPHAQECFARFAQREQEMCGEWAVFYHSYSFAALIYELHAAVAAVFFGFQSQDSTLPRILSGDFTNFPDAASLLRAFEEKWADGAKDHHPDYRAVAISAVASLVTLGPEMSTPVIFVAGYSQEDLSFAGVLEKSLASCFVPKDKIKDLAAAIIELSQRHGLDVSRYGGAPCASGKPGHLMQIFVERKLVDEVAYAAMPFGSVDKARQPLSQWLNSNEPMNFGQVRIVVNPKLFMNPESVQMYVSSADPTFDANRSDFQEELTNLISATFADPKLGEKASNGIYGGEVPEWYRAQDRARKRRQSSRCCVQ